MRFASLPAFSPPPLRARCRTALALRLPFTHTPHAHAPTLHTTGDGKGQLISFCHHTTTPTTCAVHSLPLPLPPSSIGQPVVFLASPLSLGTPHAAALWPFTNQLPPALRRAWRAGTFHTLHYRQHTCEYAPYAMCTVWMAPSNNLYPIPCALTSPIKLHPLSTLPPPPPTHIMFFHFMAKLLRHIGVSSPILWF